MFIENRITLIGFAGKDAELGSTQSGKQVARLSIATNKNYKDAEDLWKMRATWHRCVASGEIAEHVGKIQEGTHVAIEGELGYHEYERNIETAESAVRVLWTVMEILIESIKIRYRRESQEKRGAASTAIPQRLQDIRLRKLSQQPSGPSMSGEPRR